MREVLFNFSSDFLGGLKSCNFLKENTLYTVQYHVDEPIQVMLPLEDTFVVTNTTTLPGESQRDTGRTIFKPATIDSGAIINVPEFINIGDKSECLVLYHSIITHKSS